MRRRNNNISLVGASREPESAPAEGIGRVEPAPLVPAPPSQPYADPGGHVAGVLRAAEDAAEQIRADARAEAAEIVRSAQRVRDEADAYALDVRQPVEAYANQQRREAEEEARKAAAGAEAEARALREAAQEMARGLEDETRRRREALREETRALEERRNRALDDLREIASGLEDVLVTKRDRPQAPSSLDDALSITRRR